MADKHTKQARILAYEQALKEANEVIKAAEAMADAALQYQRADFELVISASDKLTEARDAFNRAMQHRKEGE